MAIRVAETAGKEAAVGCFKADLLLCGGKRVGAAFGSARDDSGSRFAGTTRQMATRVRHVGRRGEQADTDQPHLHTAFANTAQNTRVSSSSIPDSGK